MLRTPAIQGLIRRRILANYRMDPEIAARWVPAPLRPKLHRGHAIGGVCLIRLEDIRPTALPIVPGIRSENAAHRIAVEWDEGGEIREGVYIERRDSDSVLNQLAGGRLFPGKHGAARFEIDDDGRHIRFRMRGEEELAIDLEATVADALPAGSVFADLAEASAFFEAGSLGYSPRGDGRRLDAMKLVTETWSVTPLELARMSCSFFEDTSRFPAGSVEPDHALLMRDLRHRWEGQPDLALG